MTSSRSQSSCGGRWRRWTSARCSVRPSSTGNRLSHKQTMHRPRYGKGLKINSNLPNQSTYTKSALMTFFCMFQAKKGQGRSIMSFSILFSYHCGTVLILVFVSISLNKSESTLLGGRMNKANTALLIWYIINRCDLVYLVFAKRYAMPGELSALNEMGLLIKLNKCVLRILLIDIFNLFVCLLTIHDHWSPVKYR